jgi:uncharacterized RDD family membrane protein YckC
MTKTPKVRRYFHAHRPSQASALNGLPLAASWQRLLGYSIDLFFAVLLWFPFEVGWHRFILHEDNIALKFDFHEVGNIIIVVLYWGLFNYFGNGQTPGKWVSRTRIKSLTSERMGPWQSLERALGYGAAILEGGLGFAQIFWDHNRMCAQDRLAETIVVDVRRRSQPSTDSPTDS